MNIKEHRNLKEQVELNLEKITESESIKILVDNVLTFTVELEEIMKSGDDFLYFNIPVLKFSNKRLELNDSYNIELKKTFTNCSLDVIVTFEIVKY